jgi:very-short-patch-repair endonuclease
VDDLRVTTPQRTAFDLARRLPLIQSVCAIDALAHNAPFEPEAILEIVARHPGVHGLPRVANAVKLADRRAESVRESLCRLVLVSRGLPTPALQHSVYSGGDFIARLDMAYPDALVGIEYDGAGHRNPASFTADLRRANALLAFGWVILRFTSDDLIRRPDAVASQVAATLTKRRVRNGLA